MINKIASAIYNDVVSGLVGITANPTISLKQLEDDVVDEFLQILKEYSLKNLIPKKDLQLAINCIEVDCESLDKCPSCTKSNPSAIPHKHFQIPQLVNDFAEEAVEFVGSTDKMDQYKVYLDTSFQFHKYLRRGAQKPFVYIQPTPNENNMYDGWIFNAPFIKNISIIGIFKDLRQLDQYGCCNTSEVGNMSFIYAEVKKRLTEKKLRYYRQFYQQPTPNNQVAK